nr:FAD-dependent oxidoreductase [Micromonospora sp. DSM 115978]
AAAVAAARAGARVLLVEATGHLGGTSVAVLDTAYGFFAPGGSADDLVVGGIGWEVCERLLGTGAAFLRPNTYGAGTGVTYEPESLKLAWDDAVLSSGAALLLQVWTSAAVVDDQTLRGVVVETRRGPALLTAPVVVDASGDGELA